MVQELKRANESENGENTVDLRSLRKASNAKIREIKPALTKPTDAVVKDVEIKVEMDKYEHNQNDETAIYHPGVVIVTTEFKDPESGETVTSKDYFRGFRAYIALDNELSPVIEDGQEVILRYYPGTEQSGLRQFTNVVVDYAGDEINDWLDLYYDFMPGLKVKLQSEFNTFNGKTSIKQKIVRVVGKD